MIATSKEVFEFYAKRKLQPQWAAHHVTKYAGSVTIDRIIELNSGKPQTRQNYNYAAQNLCHILKMIRKNRPKELVAELYRMSMVPGTIIDAAKRAAFAAKWYTKITGEKKHCIYFGVPKEKQEYLAHVQDLVVFRGHPNAEWR